MIFGNINHKLLILIIICGTTLLSHNILAVDSTRLIGLLNGIKLDINRGLSYAETISNKTLKYPIEMQGYIYLDKDDRFRKVVTKPYSQEFVISEDEIKIISSDGTARYRTGQVPDILLIYYGMTSLTKRDPELLKKYFSVKSLTIGTCWDMRLLPKRSDINVNLLELKVYSCDNENITIKMDFKSNGSQEIRLSNIGITK